MSDRELVVAVVTIVLSVAISAAVVAIFAALSTAKVDRLQTRLRDDEAMIQTLCARKVITDVGRTSGYVIRVRSARGC